MVAVLPDYFVDNLIEPVYHGKTWELDPNWDGVTKSQKYALPQWTLGWQILIWIRENLLGDELDQYGKPLPFSPTPEQSRFLLWWYAVDENGRFLWREGILQRLKGWGKDPLAAVIAAIELVGPCRFLGWARQDYPDLGVAIGEPLAIENAKAWIQIAAVSREQTKNTMSLFFGLFTDRCKKAHNLDLGKSIIYAHFGERRIESVTSSARSLEGNRPSLVILNETHHFVRGNEGHAMADAVERNATKSKGGAGRTLSLTNAYDPSEDSVAQRQRETWEAEEAGESFRTGVYYDSLEAPPSARLRPKVRDANGEIRDADEAETREYLTQVLRGVRGDSWWLPIESMVNSILNRRNPPSRSRRFWFNQIVAAEDVWADPAAIDLAIEPLARSARRDSSDDLRAGWLVSPTEPIVSFLDCSKSSDATGLMGCRLRDGYTFTLGVWQRPLGERGEKWLVDRSDVSARVDEMFNRFKLVAFWGDPSHAKEDEDDTRYWDPLFDEWMRKYKSQLDPAFWAVKTGLQPHAIMWDMTSPERHRMFVAAAETTVSELENKNDMEEFEPMFRIDGHPALVRHLKNARSCPTSWGTSLMKESRESNKKIDLGVAAVGARMLRRFVLNRGVEPEKKPGGAVWGYRRR